jgi:hypothetical protein
VNMVCLYTHTHFYEKYFFAALCLNPSPPPSAIRLRTLSIVMSASASMYQDWDMVYTTIIKMYKAQNPQDDCPTFDSYYTNYLFTFIVNNTAGGLCVCVTKK